MDIDILDPLELQNKYIKGNEDTFYPKNGKIICNKNMFHKFLIEQVKKNVSLSDLSKHFIYIYGKKWNMKIKGYIKIMDPKLYDSILYDKKTNAYYTEIECDIDMSINIDEEIKANNVLNNVLDAVSLK